MTVALEGAWVPIDSWPRARNLAMMYTWRHHALMHRVRDDIAAIDIRLPEERFRGIHQYRTTEFEQLAQDYHADPDFVTAQLFFYKDVFFMQWRSFMQGFSVKDMIEELMLPWTEVSYFSSHGKGINISQSDAHFFHRKIDRDILNRNYLMSPILQHDDPINAYGWDVWPPLIQEFNEVEILVHDGVQAPIPVFHDYDKEELDI